MQLIETKLLRRLMNLIIVRHNILIIIDKNIGPDSIKESGPFYIML